MKTRILRKLKSMFVKIDENPLRTGSNGSFIYIHINKTGGTSIANAIGLPKKRHLTSQEVIEIVGREEFDKAFVFTSVRNPWSKVVSHYKYRVKINHTEMKEKPIPFEDWVKQTYGPDKNSFYYDIPKMFQPQIEWLKDREGNVVVECVLKFESLNRHFDAISSKLGIANHALPHLNATVKVDYRKFYSDETAQIVQDWFREDIARFGYVFGGRQ